MSTQKELADVDATGMADPAGQTDVESPNTGNGSSPSGGEHMLEFNIANFSTPAGKQILHDVGECRSGQKRGAIGMCRVGGGLVREWRLREKGGARGREEREWGGGRGARPREEVVRLGGGGGRRRRSSVLWGTCVARWLTRAGSAARLLVWVLAAGRTHTGEFTALIGPSGAGKTTLMDCIALRQRKFIGAIHIDGVSPKGDYFTQTGASSDWC